MNEPTVKFARALAALASKLADAADSALIGGRESVEGAVQTVYEVDRERRALVVYGAAALKATRADEAASDKVIDRGLAAMKTALSGKCPQCGEPNTNGGMFHENCPATLPRRHRLPRGVGEDGLPIDWSDPLAAALGDSLPAYGANEHAKAAAKIDLHPDLPHCTDPAYEETGEVREPRAGERFADSHDGHPVYIGTNYPFGPRRILRRIEAEEPERFCPLTGPMPEGGGA